ncbi:MAG: hypothetical protein MGU50_14740 [Trichodesmium sp. MAG_R02]|nr:hypothetical protein [Trichodesmium sp. MAG_R02]
MLNMPEHTVIHLLLNRIWIISRIRKRILLRKEQGWYFGYCGYQRRSKWDSYIGAREME